MAANNMLLGRGSFGEVYKVFSTTRNEYIARKWFRKEREWEMECDILKTLRPHPGLVHWFECAQDGQSYFIDMELLGMCLNDQSLKSSSGWSWLRNKEQLDRLIIQGLQALSFLHDELSIMHNDIKPANMMLNSDRSQLKICDFGLSQRINKDVSPSVELKFGSPNYMSPEFWLKVKDYGYIGDEFAYGLSWYVLLYQQGLAPDNKRALDRWRNRTDATEFYEHYNNHWANWWPRFPMSVVDQSRISNVTKNILCQLLEKDHHLRCSADEILSSPAVAKVLKQQNLHTVEWIRLRQANSDLQSTCAKLQDKLDAAVKTSATLKDQFQRKDARIQVLDDQLRKAQEVLYGRKTMEKDTQTCLEVANQSVQTSQVENEAPQQVANQTVQTNEAPQHAQPQVEEQDVLVYNEAMDTADNAASVKREDAVSSTSVIQIEDQKPVAVANAATAFAQMYKPHPSLDELVNKHKVELRRIMYLLSLTLPVLKSLLRIGYYVSYKATQLHARDQKLLASIRGHGNTAADANELMLLAVVHKFTDGNRRLCQEAVDRGDNWWSGGSRQKNFKKLGL